MSVYGGDNGRLVARVGPGVTVGINVTADIAFKPALDAIAALHADLLSGNPVQGATLAGIDGGLQGITDAWTDIGARQNRLTQTQQGLGAIQVSTQKLLSDLEDTDLAAAITELTTRETAYEAAIKTNARILSTSLLDYLR